ncbi:MAG: PAS domain-containing protein, partial [Bacteroidota bacterium]|nr:PAS domain-containing protein [Bacteroidota bacterium]
MNSFFRRLPLPLKLLFIGLIPLAFLIFLSIKLYEEKTQKIKLLESYIERINQSANVNELINDLQNERKYSFDYALKKNNRRNLVLQRPHTDASINRIKITNDESFAGFVNYTNLKKLDQIRSDIDKNKIGPDVVMHFYSNAIFRLNTLNPISSGNSIYLEPVYKDLVAQKLLSEMITYLGMIRSNIYNVLHTRKYVVETLVGTMGTHDVYNSYEIEFLQKASPAVVQYYKNVLTNTSLKQTREYIDTVFSRFAFDSTYTAESWWEISDSGVNQLSKLQQNIWKNVQNKINSILRAERKDKDRTLIFLIIALVIVLSVVSYTISVITRMLNELKYGALKLSQGKTGLRLKVFSKDALGSLAKSILRIDENNQQLSDAANTIGQGNFNTIVQPRSKDDLLGNAIIQMKDNLQRFTKENEESKEQFRQLADFMPQMVWTSRPDGFLDYYNKQWYDYTGFKENFGDQSWVPILHPDDVKLCMDTWYSAVNMGTPYHIEYRFKNKNTGDYRWFLGKALPIKDKEGNVIKWFGTCTDIHEQKTLSESLEAQVHERTEELKRSNEDLLHFAHVASHDLKEPLRKIKTFGNLLSEEYANDIPKKGKAFLDKIQYAADRMSKMVEGVLNYSTINSGEQTFEIINLNDVIDEIKSDLELSILQKEAAITVDPLPAIKGINILIHQLFY